MPDEPLTEDIDTGRYGRFAGPPSRQDLDRDCFLDDADMKLVAKRRGDANRLGFSLQLVTVRYLGTFLADPLDVPTEVVDYVAEQLGISDPSCLKAYMGREKTRFEHQWEIAREDDWRDFADAEDELVRWIDDRAWITGDGPRTLFDAAVGWMRERQVLLPAASTLERLVGRVGEEATQRFWNALATIPTPAQATRVEALLDVAPGSHFSDLDRLRQGPVMASGRSLALSLDRVAEIAAFGFGGVDLSAVPRRRVVDLARYGMAGKATLLRRHPKPRKVATLLATVVHLQAKAIDDALELFDFLMVHELLASAQRATRDETLRRYPLVSQNAGKLAAAMEVLVRMRDSGASLDPEAIWQAVERVVSWTEIRTAVESLRQVVPAPGEDPDAAWRGALVGRYATVSRFLPKLVATIDFGATAGARPVLEAFQKLPALMAPGAAVDVPARHLRVDQVAADLVPPAWRRMVFPSGRPEGTVHRAGYVFCILEQFHQRLVHRDIFAPASSRWADPRAQLLSGAAWEAVKDQVLNGLQLSEDPADRLAQLATVLDAGLKDVAARLDSDIRATIDEQGRLHAEALNALDEPASLLELRRRTQAMMPRVDIEELVLEVMSWLPEVVGAFTAVSGGETRMVDLAVTLAAVLVSRALNIGYGPVISHRVEALTRARISHVDQTYIRNETLGPANGPIFDHQARVPLVRDHWGGGQVAAADGVRFVVPVRSIHARPNPKYFGRRRGVTWLNMVNDRSMGTAAMVVAGTPRDSLHVVDLIYRQEAGPRPEVVISDAGSYSDIVFGLLNLLDIEYRPEPADLPDTKLWHIDRDADYGALATAARGRIDLGRITAHWPDLVRIAGSIHTGAVSAHDVIRMISKGGGLTQLGEALAHYGRIFKTLHILSYVDVEPYRRQNKRMRNLQEGRHDLARHLFHGRRGELYEAYREGMEDQLGALGLVLNMATLWNTVYLDAAVAKLRADGHPVRDEDVARLSAYIREHINVHGHRSFELGDLGAGQRPLRDPDRVGDAEA
jgi:TnpA family transposase